MSAGNANRWDRSNAFGSILYRISGMLVLVLSDAPLMFRHSGLGLLSCLILWFQSPLQEGNLRLKLNDLEGFILGLLDFLLILPQRFCFTLHFVDLILEVVTLISLDLEDTLKGLILALQCSILEVESVLYFLNVSQISLDCLLLGPNLVQIGDQKMNRITRIHLCHLGNHVFWLHIL